MENGNNQNPKNGNPNAVQKLEAVRAAKQLQNPNSQWTVLQEVLQEIIAGHIVSNPDTVPPATKLAEELKTEIESRYADDDETKDLLVSAIPQPRAIREWMKKDGWEDAVWSRIRGEQLFSHEKRSQVIESLRVRAIEKSDVAAKIWLTLSGDYSEKMEVNDKTIDTFREINSILHNKKKSEE